MHKIIALCKVRNLEFLRDRGALIWNLIVPVFLLLALNSIFSEPNKKIFKIGVIGENTTEEQIFKQIPGVKLKYFSEQHIATRHLEGQQIVALLDLSQNKHNIIFNQNSEKSKVLQLLISQNKDFAKYSPLQLESVSIRYLDWVFPGILAINMMYSCLYGVGYAIVRYRRFGYLKFLHTTPVKPLDFIVSQAISRLIVTQIVTFIIFLGAKLLLNPRVEGSLLTLLLLSVISAFTLISLSLLMSSRVESEELSRGLLELIAWPMLLFSGAFFSIESSHIALHWIAQCLPLTHIITPARELMLYGASLNDIMPHLLVLVGMSVVFLGFGAKLFRWGS